VLELGVLTATPHLPIYQELLAAGPELGVVVHLWDATRWQRRCREG
jgi:hypothetical protein